MPDAPLLPELARSLRGLGDPRDSCSAESHAAILAPLLDARARANADSREAALVALNGGVLAKKITSLAGDAASRDVQLQPRARALRASAEEAIGPLTEALAQLDRLAEPARASDEAWQRWIDGLRHAFARADEACRTLARVIAERDRRDKPPRWYARGTQ